MATGTAATNAALTALSFPGSFITPDGIVSSIARADADIATIQQLIKDDQNPAQPINLPTGGWSRAGQLFVPNRGWLKLMAGGPPCAGGTGRPLLLFPPGAASSAARDPTRSPDKTTLHNRHTPRAAPRQPRAPAPT